MYHKGNNSSRTEDEKSERAVKCNKVDSWTAGSMLGSQRLCLCASTHACKTLTSEDNVRLLFSKVKHKTFDMTRYLSKIMNEY